MESAAAGAKFDIAAGSCATPDTRSAMDTLLAVERRVASGRAHVNRFAGANLDTHRSPACVANGGLQEYYVVFQTRRSGHLAPEQQCVLLAHQQLSVEGNLRPPGAIHQCVMQ